LTPDEAAKLLHDELFTAALSLRDGAQDDAFDAYVRAIGLALQLGPVPTGEALAALLQAAHSLVQWQMARGLSSLGPAVVNLVSQIRDSGALPGSDAMEAWATVTEEIGTLIGQLGLALEIHADHRAGMVQNLRARAGALDDATGSLFDLSGWVEELVR
jgi:hypothetical protein